MKHLFFMFGIVICIVSLGCGGSSSGGIFNPASPIDFFDYVFRGVLATTTPGVPWDCRTIVLNPVSKKAYVGAYDGLYEITMSGDNPSFSKISATFASDTINALFVETSGDLLIGTDRGLYRRNYSTGAISSVPGLEDKKILAITVQSGNILWVGLEDISSNTISVAKSENNAPFTFFGNNEGMTASSVVFIYADNEQPELVFACGVGGNDGLFQLAGKKFKIQDDVPLTNGATVFFKTDTNWYVGGKNVGLYTTSTSGATRKWTNVIKDVTPNWVWAVKSGQHYECWLATDKGLYLSFNLSYWKKFDRTNGLADNNCKAVSIKQGYLWVAHPQPNSGVSYGYLRTN